METKVKEVGAVLRDNKTSKRVTTVVQHSDRLILVKIQAEPVDIVSIQVYTPTSSHSEEEVEDAYEQKMLMNRRCL